MEGGVGVDRKAGAYRVSTNVVLTRQTEPDAVNGDRTHTTLVGSLDRSFASDTRHVRLLAVYNPGEQSAFARLIATLNLRDNVQLAASGGWFTGQGDDSLSLLATRDFAYARLKVFF
ncbi:MAG: hypothetical protein H0T71_15460 [Acidobacteria bacterium]|nr:hypothetical protein [Acidobacteriota bacterium]